ncbi:hypothetical protein SpiGrapes_1111 [Sphaerochaeta pleomorpha str. Grapes]|uniref:Uncharacterized protein n=1 Tax=Sphaerochaeta pleomorpha (strain ATCC BAA-1885 / DSM 22778 / Grapes) TaxID=158190 RepID=G8QS70_SPHPG|nr:hypothetical protein [Sphaerochaeta pleomorpha]AEV28931.1 hypothetical protein SpiGrapes_1111 [Sphaerochaeta pleomorpha str. Grapes]
MISHCHDRDGSWQRNATSDLWDENGRWVSPDDPRYQDYWEAWVDSLDSSNTHEEPRTEDEPF